MDMSSIRTLLLGLAIRPLLATSLPVAAPLPVFFVENKGQASSDIRFLVQGSALTASFSPGKIVFQNGGRKVQLEFVGAKADPILEGLDALSGRGNFFVGGAQGWHSGVPLYNSILYKGLYPNVNLNYVGSAGRLKSEFRVKPGGNPSVIRMHYMGAAVKIERGTLVLHTEAGDLREEEPVIYQEIGGKRKKVDGAFRENADGTVGFAVGAYEHSAALIIDPVISFSTYLGGSGTDIATGVAVDTNGSIYVTGYTASADFPTANPVQSRDGGGNDVFVAKFAGGTHALVYCTYLGGSSDDRAYGIAVDSSGSAYITGSTASTNFPLHNPLQARLLGTKNAFIAKLSPTGNSLAYSTYLGGNGADAGNGIAIDTNGNAYIVGDTTSATFPSTGYQRAYHGSQDVFVLKMSPDGTKLVYATFLGGSSVDHGSAIAVDTYGAAYVTGSTYSTDFPTKQAFQTANAGGQDVFITKISADGSSLVFSTYAGGTAGTASYPEVGQGIAVDPQGEAYVVGVTSSPNFPVMNPLQSALNGWTDAFLLKLNPSGYLSYGTYFGGSGIDAANSVAVDANGCAVVVGYSNSTDLPVASPVQAGNAGDYDAFVAQFGSSGNTLMFSSYLGGNGSDTASAVTLDSGGNIYLAGQTQSTNFPLHTAYQQLNGGLNGGFVAELQSGPTSGSTGAATTIWSSTASPKNPLYLSAGVTLGVKFRSDVGGSITGVRFYKGSGNSGIHIGLLYGSTGVVLAQAIFTNESQSGWQQVSFQSPVNIAANATYVVAYWTGSGFAYDGGYFTANGVDNPPLHALRAGTDGPNGVYAYGSNPAFPSSDAFGNFYWADVVFVPAAPSAPTPDLVIAGSHSGNFSEGQVGAAYTITVTNSGTTATVGIVSVNETLPSGLTATAIAGNGWTCTQPAGPCSRTDPLIAGSSFPPIVLTVNVSPTAGPTVTNSVGVSGGGETNTANDQASDLTTISSAGSAGSVLSIWGSTASPTNPFYNSPSVTLGVKFRSDVDGTISGVRFYKGIGNNGTHIGLLYGAAGNLLAQATFTGETSSGWQQVNFSTPVAISANSTYIIAYWTNSGFAYDAGYFTNSGIDNAPLHALRTGIDGPNGVYAYGSSPAFPASDAYGNFYWADVIISSGLGDHLKTGQW
jgi:uncharacterized repeat protein (TIGR01451 family)